MNEKSKKKCARCGSCAVVCPVFRVTGLETLTARGKLHLLNTDLAGDPSDHFQDIFSQCLLCGACEDNCSRQLPIKEEIVQARSTFSHFYGQHGLKKALVRNVLSRPALLEKLCRAGLSLSRLSLLPRESGLRIKLGLFEEDQKYNPEAGDRNGMPAEGNLSYFSGCMARYLQPSIGEATGELAARLTGGQACEPDAQTCCGLAAWSAGRLDEARRLAKKNIEVFEGTPGDILTSCASCSTHLSRYPDLLQDEPGWRDKAEAFSRRVREFTSFIHEKMQEDFSQEAAAAKVYFHVPCHMRFEKGDTGAVRQLFDKLDNVSLVSPEAGPRCCGQGGLFHLGYPELSDDIFSTLHEQVEQVDIDAVVTTCSGCLMQWQAGLAARGSQLQAVHLVIWLMSHLRINS